MVTVLAVIVGAGGLARSILSVFDGVGLVVKGSDRYEHVKVVGFRESPRTEDEKLFGLPVRTNWLSERGINYVMGIGEDPWRKERLVHEIETAYPSGEKAHWLTLLAPSCHVSDYAKIDQTGGNVFMPGSFVDPDAEIGRFNIFMNNCFIGHHAKIGNYCTIGQGTVIGGRTVVEDFCYFGTNVSVINEHWETNPIRIMKAARVGSNAVVVKHSVLRGQTVVGVPARPI